MRAWILDQSPGAYRSGEMTDPHPGPGDVRVRVIASALNHTDLWLRRGLPAPSVLPHVPGCDAAGVVDAVGDGVERVAVGDEVVINPAVSCRRCRLCLAGQSPLCARFQILGVHRWGTHADHVVVPADNVSPRPVGRSWEECAAFGLVGLTAWRMVKRARIVAGHTVIVVGAGGGVGLAAVVLAHRMGARVIAVSRREHKQRRTLELGADVALDTAAEWGMKADVVLDSVGPDTWEQSVRALAPGGRLVVCGATSGSTVELSLPRLFFQQHEIIGSTMGSYEEWDELVTLVGQGLAVVVDEVVARQDYPAALDRLAAGDQLGKIVLRHDA